MAPGKHSRTANQAAESFHYGTGKHSRTANQAAESFHYGTGEALTYSQPSS
ncbi:hypothetical protein DPMN_042571 [Dreissena polymorpha]|uniref:Uncharacterized protein n=1 Tax=Dreissena polymorpha TaxID=45954 RepID=A0A9D4D182_DREPO|nr:hypothetical protein DPMN_042564 [Dreissena polymorpha]KAH3736011.1 hypothetical protein DPMN_042571 [Dreissena polymorpha]